MESVLYKDLRTKGASPWMTSSSGFGTRLGLNTASQTAGVQYDMGYSMEVDYSFPDYNFGEGQAQ